MNSISDQLRLARLSRRVSQVDLAARVGFSTATLCRIERGDKQPTPQEVQAIARAINELPGGDAPEPIQELAKSKKRLRIQIGLEDFDNVIRPRAHSTERQPSGKNPCNIVFYVDVENLDLSAAKIEFDDDEVLKYPRQR